MLHSSPVSVSPHLILSQQVLLLYSGARDALVATTINALILAYIQRDVVAAPTLRWWLLYMLTVTIARAALVLSYSRSQSSMSDTSWKHAYATGATLSGLGWGAAGLALFPADSIPHQVFLVFMLGGMAAGGVALLTPRIEVFFLFFFPTLIPIIWRLMIFHDEMHWTMAGALLLFFIALLFTAFRLHRMIVSSLTLRTENTDLVQYLSDANLEARRLNADLTTEIHHRQETETALRESQEQLLQSQKMEAMGQLAGGIAHDFNNLVMVINGYSELLLHSLTDQTQRREVEQIKLAGDRAAALTQKMLAFSRRQVSQPRPIDLNQVISNLTPMMSRLIGETIAVVTTLGTIGQVKADPMQIEQVLLNLALNARDAMPHGGTLAIETSNVELDQTYTAHHKGAQIGAYVRLIVKDTGRGMDAETTRRVFEPFFTTKEVGKGTGLGLSMVYGIVKQSGGYTDVFSRPGCGSTFTVYLPRLSSAIATSPPPLAARPLPTGRESILLVEDEPAVRTLIGSILRQQGYEVLEAPHGDEALRLIQETRHPIHLLVTDLVMPHLGGKDLAQCLAVRRPGMKVLYISGYLDDALLKREGVTASTTFLRKPFTSEVLCGKIREVLDQSAENHPTI